MASLFEKQYCILDFETTGFSYRTDEIIEIAILRYDGKVFSTLVNPERPIQKRITEITGIDDLSVQSAPVISEVIKDVFAFIGNSYLICHNASFDIPFLQKAIERAFGKKCNFWGYCTLAASRKFLNLPSKSLSFVSSALGFKGPTSHRALNDVKHTEYIFGHLVNNFHRPLSESWEDAQNRGILKVFSASDLDCSGSGPSGDKVNHRVVSEKPRNEIKVDPVMVEFEYISRTGERLMRTVRLESIIQETRRRTFVGHCILRNEERSFKASRILGEMRLVSSNTMIDPRLSTLSQMLDFLSGNEKSSSGRSNDANSESRMRTPESPIEFSNPEIKILLSDEIKDQIAGKTVNGSGGFQSILLMLQKQLIGNSLVLKQSDLSRIRMYASGYGKGGFQRLLKNILEAGKIEI